MADDPQRNFRSAYYEKVGFRGVEEKKSLEILLKDSPLGALAPPSGHGCPIFKTNTLDYSKLQLFMTLECNAVMEPSPPVTTSVLRALAGVH